MKKITIIGGGNIGTLLAANMAAKNRYSVNILTTDRNKWSNKIEVFDGDDNLLRTGVLDNIYDNAKEAFTDADIIICTLPSNVYHKKIKEYLPLISNDTYFGVIPGMGGKEFPFYTKNYEKVKFFAFQRVPGVARIKDYGNAVYDLGERDLLHYAVNNITNSENDELKKEFELMFGIQCQQLDNILSVTLTPSNPILHTSRLYGLSKMMTEGFFMKDYLFYNDWDDFSSSIIFGMDQEVQDICSSLKELSLFDVKSLKEHYESESTKQLTLKLRSIKSLSKIKSPFLESGDKFIFDLSSRYFTEDFLYGLCIIKSFIHVLSLKSPFIDEVLKWYEDISGFEFFKDGIFIGDDLIDLPLPQNYGLTSRNRIISFYSDKLHDLEA